MKDAYIILCHQSPWQINELTSYLTSHGHDVYIHVDASSEIAGQLRTSVRVHLVEERVKVEWADWSVAEATLAAIRSMPQYGAGYRYVHLLSGQCLPAKPLAELDAELDARASEKVQFMECEALPRRSAWGRDGGIHRVGTWYPRWMVSKYSPWHRWFWPYTNKWIRLRMRRPGYFIHGPFYGGAQWWSLTGDCVSAIAEYADKHSFFCRFFHHTFCSDELFFQTCLVRCGYLHNVRGDNKRFLKWEFPDAPSPLELQREHWAELWQSGAYFGRKFSMEPGATEAYLQSLEKISDFSR